LAQAPQFWLSVLRFTQASLQSLSGFGQLVVQTPFAHTLPAAHALPHLPQLSGSLVVSTQPLAHAVVPASQAHLLATHAWRVPQVTPQPPQFFGSLVPSTQPVMHASSWPGHAQLPWLHVSGAPQVTPHFPQFAGSVLVSTQLCPHSTLGAVQLA